MGGQQVGGGVDGSIQCDGNDPLRFIEFADGQVADGLVSGIHGFGAIERPHDLAQVALTDDADEFAIAFYAHIAVAIQAHGVNGDDGPFRLFEREGAFCHDGGHTARFIGHG